MSATWRHLGFHETTEEQLAGWNVEDADLVHMQNTLQVCVWGGWAFARWWYPGFLGRVGVWLQGNLVRGLRVCRQTG